MALVVLERRMPNIVAIWAERRRPATTTIHGHCDRRARRRRRPADRGRGWQREARGSHEGVRGEVEAEHGSTHDEICARFDRLPPKQLPKSHFVMHAPNRSQWVGGFVSVTDRGPPQPTTQTRRAKLGARLPYRVIHSSINHPCDVRPRSHGSFILLVVRSATNTSAHRSVWGSTFRRAMKQCVRRSRGGG